MTPVHLVAGFLGAGKTTAIGNWLKERKNEQVALIVNDFGEAGFDDISLSEEDPFEIKNIPGGCICCTAPEGFADALTAVLDQNPDRIIIEPTGLARPQDLVDVILRPPLNAKIELAPVVVLVDPTQLSSASKESEQLIKEQAEAADILVANRIDLAEQEDLEEFDRWAKSLWPGPIETYRTSFGRLPEETLEWPENEGLRAPSGTTKTHSHHSTEGFVARSWKWSQNEIFSYSRLQEILAKSVSDKKGGTLVRFKGIFRTQEGTSFLEMSGGILHDRVTSYRRDSRADAIFEGPKQSKLDSMEEGLKAALLKDEERDLPIDRIQISPEKGEPYLVERRKLASLPEGLKDIGQVFERRKGAAARLDSLWTELDLHENGRAIVVAFDGFATEPIPITSLMSGFLIHSLDGNPLPEDKGGPFRLLIPEETPGVPSSCANVKGVVKIVLRD